LLAYLPVFQSSDVQAHPVPDIHSLPMPCSIRDNYRPPVAGIPTERDREDERERGNQNSNRAELGREGWKDRKLQ